MKKLGWLKLRLHLEQPFIVYIPYEFIKNIVIYHPELGFKGNHQFVSYVLISPSVEKHHDLGTLFKKDTKCLDGFVNFNRRSDKVRSKIICQNFKPGRHQFVEIWHWRNIFYFLIKRFLAERKRNCVPAIFDGKFALRIQSKSESNRGFYSKKSGYEKKGFGPVREPSSEPKINHSSQKFSVRT